jgi:hypothetical protein
MNHLNLLLGHVVSSTNPQYKSDQDIELLANDYAVEVHTPTSNYFVDLTW